MVSIRTFTIMKKTYSLQCLEITESDAGPHIKGAVNLVITDTFVFFGAFCGYVWVNPLTFNLTARSPLRLHVFD